MKRQYAYNLYRLKPSVGMGTRERGKRIATFYSWDELQQWARAHAKEAGYSQLDWYLLYDWDKEVR